MSAGPTIRAAILAGGELYIPWAPALREDLARLADKVEEYDDGSESYIGTRDGKYWRVVMETE